MSDKSRRKAWTVTVTVDGRDMGHYRDVQAVEPWTAVYAVLRYGVAPNYTLRDIEGMTITVRPTPVPPTVPAAEGGAS